MRSVVERCTIFGVSFRKKNADAIRFYEAHGFHITDNKMLEEGTPEYKVMVERNRYV
ncbi:MAG: hypothetical protein K5779_06100 [Saccharofermentans sp.]|nr:hypothetical protein [Saccharofermentans sp.]